MQPVELIVRLVFYWVILYTGHWYTNIHYQVGIALAHGQYYVANLAECKASRTLLLIWLTLVLVRMLT